MNYLFFDEQFNYVAQGSGFQRVETAGNGSKVQVSLYGYTQDSLYHQRSAMATSVRSVSSLLAQGGWQHLTLVFSGSLSDPWKLYINGNPVALQYTTNTLTAGVTLAATTGLVVGANPDPHTGPSDKLQGALKNLRLYNRVLAIGEIRQNAFNNCQLAANPAGVVFWSPLNEATGNQVREVYSDTTGTLTGFTWQPGCVRAEAGLFYRGLPTRWRCGCSGLWKFDLYGAPHSGSNRQSTVQWQHLLHHPGPF